MNRYGIVLLWIGMISWMQAALPGGVSGVQLWLRADKGISVSSGSSVSQWDDQSGNGWDATQSNGTYQPTWTDNTANFNPALSFHDHFLDVDYHKELNGADLTVLTVVLANGSNNNWRSPWTTRDDTPQKGHILYRLKTSNDYDYWNGNGSSWNRLDTGVTPTWNYEILTTRAENANIIGTSINKKVYIQGVEKGSKNNQTFSPNTQQPFRIGKGSTETTDGQYPWYGYITETIVFNEPLDDTDRNRVESYLALKYGITLTQTQDYSDCGSNTVWSASSNSGYGNDIAGLSLDTGTNCSDLDQRVSKSIDDDAVITMSTDTDFSSANPGSRPQLSSSSGSFLIWSNDDGGNGWTDTGAPAGGQILERKWKVQKSGTPGSVNIQVDVNDGDFDIDNFNGSLFFVHGSDLSTAKPLKMTDDGSGKWHIENIDFDDGDLFSFVIAPEPPANQAEMVINEILYRQKTSGSDQINEFVEFYVTSSGTLKDLIIHDMESTPNPYTFPDVDVSDGDYVIVHYGSGTNTSSGGVHHLYTDTLGFSFNNSGDDLSLYKPVNDDITMVDGEWHFVIPVDYVAFGTNNANSGAVGEAPQSEYGHIQPDWTYDKGTELDNADYGQTISLTPNAADSDKAACWELTTSGNASDNGCANYIITRQTDLTYKHSQGESNNGNLPEMHITKSSIVIDDPVNGTTDPKRIPGATIRYCFTVDNNGTGDADDVAIHDSLTGGGRDNLIYVKSGKLSSTQAISVACDCTSSSLGSDNDLSGTDVTIDLGTIQADQRQCAYIEVTIQ